MKPNQGIGNYQKEIATQVIERSLERITSIDGTPLSLILPAGQSQPNYEVLASGLKQLDGKLIDQIILISTTPESQTSKEISLLKKGELSTPVGKIEIDNNLAEAVSGIFPTQTNNSKADFHTQFGQILPFIKRVSPFTKILPILIHPTDIDTAQQLALRLAEMLNDKQATLITLSNIEALTLTTVEFGDVNLLRQSIPHIQEKINASQIITHAGITAAVQFAQSKGSNTVTVLKNIPDLQSIPQQKSNQASIMFYKYTPPTLVKAQQEDLLKIAKSAISSHLKHKEIPRVHTDDPAYLRKTGVFVTLRQNGKLRGCIGRLQSDTPLYKVLQETAISAAISDPRFLPIQHEDIDQLTFKIAILSPLQRITTEDVQVGTHGLLIAHKGRRGVLLPDVPISRGWDKETFLANLCIKAGLPQNAWRENPTLYAFSTVEFGNE